MASDGQPENPVTGGDDDQKEILDLLKGGFDTEQTLNLRILVEKQDPVNTRRELGETTED
jgi:hypothetical protein